MSKTKSSKENKNNRTEQKHGSLWFSSDRYKVQIPIVDKIVDPSSTEIENRVRVKIENSHS